MDWNGICDGIEREWAEMGLTLAEREERKRRMQEKMTQLMEELLQETQKEREKLLGEIRELSEKCREAALAVGDAPKLFEMSGKSLVAKRDLLKESYEEILEKRRDICALAQEILTGLRAWHETLGSEYADAESNAKLIAESEQKCTPETVTNEYVEIVCNAVKKCEDIFERRVEHIRKTCADIVRLARHMDEVLPQEIAEIGMAFAVEQPTDRPTEAIMRTCDNELNRLKRLKEERDGKITQLSLQISQLSREVDFPVEALSDFLNSVSAPLQKNIQICEMRLRYLQAEVRTMKRQELRELLTKVERAWEILNFAEEDRVLPEGCCTLETANTIDDDEVEMCKKSLKKIVDDLSTDVKNTQNIRRLIKSWEDMMEKQAEYDIIVQNRDRFNKISIAEINYEDRLWRALRSKIPVLRKDIPRALTDYNKKYGKQFVHKGTPFIETFNEQVKALDDKKTYPKREAEIRQAATNAASQERNPNVSPFARFKTTPQTMKGTLRGNLEKTMNNWTPTKRISRKRRLSAQKGLTPTKTPARTPMKTPSKRLATPSKKYPSPKKLRMSVKFE